MNANGGEARVLVTSAGTGATNNLVRSLRAGLPALEIAGCHHDRLVLRKGSTEHLYLVSTPSARDAAGRLAGAVRAYGADLLIAGNDTDALMVSAARHEIACEVLLPDHAVIEHCQDKYALALTLIEAGVPVAPVEPVHDRASVETAFERLDTDGPLWCRMRSGYGSMGATPVKDADQAWAWIRYWEEMRGIDPREFTLSNYLPGRDFNVQGLWRGGALVLVKLFERVSYYGGAARPSGTSSTPAVAKTGTPGDPLVRAAIATYERAVRAIDPDPRGIYNCDLKGDAHSVPCVTEINAGRFATVTNIYDLTGTYNMAAEYVRTAIGTPLDIADPVDIEPDCYIVRDLDTEPGVFHADDFFTGIEAIGAE